MDFVAFALSIPWAHHRVQPAGQMSWKLSASPKEKSGGGAANRRNERSHKKTEAGDRILSECANSNSTAAPSDRPLKKIY
jgi:hypothetical protein